MSSDSNRGSQQSWHAHAASHGPRRSGGAQDGTTAVSGAPGDSAANFHEPEMKAKLLRDWQLVKRARFHAADRLEKRNFWSLITLSSVALYGGLLTVFVLIFKDSLTPHVRSIFDWMSAVASWLTLTFSLTEQIKNYNGKARELHDCARRVNDLRKRLDATYIPARHNLIPFIDAYDNIISECEPNHDGLDFEIARFEGPDVIAGFTRDQKARHRSRLKIWSKVKTITPYVVMSGAPALAGLIAYALLPLPVAAVLPH
jgi:SMODS and SLOG-associating 2TM effector domain family 5